MAVPLAVTYQKSGAKKLALKEEQRRRVGWCGSAVGRVNRQPCQSGAFSSVGGGRQVSHFLGRGSVHVDGSVEHEALPEAAGRGEEEEEIFILHFPCRH